MVPLITALMYAHKPHLTSWTIKFSQLVLDNADSRHMQSLEVLAKQILQAKMQSAKYTCLIGNTYIKVKLSEKNIWFTI